jgi:hypothetical protein
MEQLVMKNHPRIAILFITALLAAFLPTACRQKSAPPGVDIHQLVATGMLGTRQAWAIGTIVSATHAALAARAATPAPIAASSPSPSPAPLPTTEDPCSNPNTGKPVGGKLSYSDNGVGYCLFYPDDFFVNKPVSGGVEFLGRALDQSAEPLRAYIRIASQEPVKGRTLDEIARSVWKDAHPGYRITNIQLGGQDALVAEDLVIDSSRWMIRQVLFTHKGMVYLITLSPVDPGEPYSKATLDVERFWEMAQASFVFLK